MAGIGSSRSGRLLACFAAVLAASVFLANCAIPENPLFAEVKLEVQKTKVSPEIAVTQSAVEYASWGSPYVFLPPIKVDTSGTPVEFRIENRGTDTLNVASITLGDTTNYSLTPPLLPLAIPPGDWASFSVTFEPEIVATITTTVSIDSDDGDEGSFALNLSAESLAPVAEIALFENLTEYSSGGSAYSFGQLPNGVVGSPVTFSVKNNGDTSLTVSAMSLGDTTNFALSAPAMPFSVNPSASRTFTIAFQPKSVNTFNSSVSISSNDSDENPFVLNITGQGTVRDSIAVSSTNPANAALDVRIDTNILVVFDRVINPATITGTTVKQGATNLPYSSSWDAGTKTLTLNPNSDLPTLAAITVTLPNTITGYNYELFAGHSFSFNTGTAWHDGNTVFVATSGNDTNSGTKSAPKRSVQAGLDTAVSKNYTQVYVAEGLYNRTNGGLQQVSTTAGLQIATTTAMSIIGGWNSAFTVYSANSELNGENYFDHVVWIQASNLTFKNFTIKGGKADGSYPHNYGGGILFYNSTSRSTVTVENVTVDGNTSTGEGGGVFIDGHCTYITLKTCKLQNNSSGSRGGGICVVSSNITLDDVDVEFNAGYTGGIYLSSCSQTTIKNCFIRENNGSSFDGIELWGGSGITLQGNYIYTMNDYCLALNTNSGSNITALVITGNQFSSSTYGGTFTAIKEGQSDITGHTITNNSFLPNFIGNLYQDNNPTTPIPDTTAGLATLNTANSTSHDAATASGNTLVY